MTDTTAQDSPESHDDEAEPSPFRVAMGFFILPLLLVLGGIGVFLMFGVLAHDGTHASEYLPAINGRGINEPWQAAFHLSQQLQYDDDLHGDPEFARQVVHAMEQADDGDPRVRRFLAVALGRIGHPLAAPTLTAHLQDADPEVRVNSLWALGSIDAREAAPAAALLLRDDDTGVRTMAAYVLGVLADPATGDALAVTLNDPVPAVRWNAAVALARMGDAAGYEQLLKMLDRDYLATVPGVEEEERSETMLAALAAVQNLDTEGLDARLRALRDSDPDLRVREAARRALETSDAAALNDSAPRFAGDGP